MPKIRKDNMSVEQKREALRLFKAGSGVSRIAVEIDKSRTAVIKYLTDLGLYTPSKKQLDLSGLATRDRLRLKHLAEAGTSYRVIAMEFGFMDWQQARNTLKRLGFMRLRHAVVHASGKRRCHECKRVRPLARFANKGYLCVDCQWFYMARYNYGIPREKLERMLVQQAGRCAICLHKCRSRRNLCVDHDHETQVVRGLLCTRCNTGVELFSDEPARIKRAALYVRRIGVPRDEEPVPYGQAAGNRRHYKRKAAFGLTPVMFDSFMRQQAGRCAICRGLPLNSDRALAVDHNHHTDHIRGLLCENCNRAIGLFEDDPDRLTNAVKYLRKRYARTHHRSEIATRLATRTAEQCGDAPVVDYRAIFEAL